MTFKDFVLSPAIQATLESLGFQEPTEIQRKAIPMLLAQSKIDFHGQAQTGTGKTLAFGIPLMHRIDATSKTTQALIVAPTRELAVQICDSLRPFARASGVVIEAVYGGVSMEDQMRALKRGVHVVVGTPGRLNDHLRRKTLNISAIKTLVLDEADIMLDMGFKEEVDEILAYAPKNREIWLFSATVKSCISTLVNEHMHDVQSVRVSKSNVGTNNTKQYFCVLPSRSRLEALCRFIECAPEFYGFVFCQTKILTSEIADQLTVRGYRVGALHGDMSQGQRNAVIKKFKEKELSIVVATDVAARGIDIANLTHVINYSFPEDHEGYVHRIGRTGRAGKDGIAITFINRSEVSLVKYIQRKFNVTIEPLDVPSQKEIMQGRLARAQGYVADIILQNQCRYKDDVEAMLQDYSAEQIKDIACGMIYEKFLQSLEGNDITFTPASKANLDEAHVQEIALAVGTDEDITRDDVVGHLTQTGLVTEDQIKKIRIIKRKTFIEIPANCVDQLINALRHSSLGGRKTRIQRVEEQQQQNNNQRRFGGRQERRKFRY